MQLGIDDLQCNAADSIKAAYAVVHAKSGSNSGVRGAAHASGAPITMPSGTSIPYLRHTCTG